MLGIRGEVVRTALGLAFERSLRIEDRPVGKAAAFGLAAVGQKWGV